MALSNKTLEGIQKSVKLHLNWLIKSIVGEEALTAAELKDLEGFTLLPSSSLNFIKKSFFLGRLSAVLRKKEYKEVTLSAVEKAMQTATLSPIELLAIQEAKQSAGLHFKTLTADIEAGIYSKLAATNLAVVNEATVLNIVRDEVAFAILKHKTWTELAENMSQSLKTENSKKIQKIARTELHAAKQKGIVQAIANKVDIYGISDGPDSLVSVVTHAGRCEDCASLYEENGSYKIFKLSELLKNGTNIDSKHTRENGLHNHWKPVVPPAHPQCFCEIRYIPPGATWQGKTLVLAAPEALQKAIGDSKLSAVQKPKGPPPSGPQAPATPGNVPGVASPAKGVGTAGAKPSNKKQGAGPTGIVYEYFAGNGQPPSDGGWEAYQKQDGSTGHRRPAGSGKHGSGKQDDAQNQQSPEDIKAAAVYSSKEWGKLGHSSATALTRLKEAKILDEHPMGADEKGITESYRVSLADGPRAMLKPNAFHDNAAWNAGLLEGDGAQAVPPETYAKREEAAYHGYNMLGLTDFVPPTTTREHNGKIHSIQQWSETFDSVHHSIGTGDLAKKFVKKHGKEAAKGVTEASEILFKAIPDDKKEEFMEKWQAGVAAGIIFNHNDQHLGNVIVDSESWDVKFIDNSMSFGNGMEGCKNEAHLNMHNLGMKLKVPEKLMTKIKNTSLGDVKRSLGAHIEDWAVGQTFLRMQYIAHLQETEGHLDYEKFRPTYGNGLPEEFRTQQPRKAMWGDDKTPSGKEKILKEFNRRRKAGLLQNQLFNSFAKQWIQDSMKLPDDHPHKIAAKELDEVGVFMGAGFVQNPAEYRKSNQHREFEKTIKPGYPPKDIKSANGLGTSATIPKTRVSGPKAPRSREAFGKVQEEILSISDLESVTEELSDSDIEVIPSKKKSPQDDMKTKKSLGPRLYIRLTDAQKGNTLQV